MNIKVELLKEYVIGFINAHIQDFEIDADRIADSLAITILAEIQGILKNENCSDFEVVEEIVSIFESHGIDTGSRHDF